MLAGSIYNTEPQPYINHKCLGHPDPAQENSPGFPAWPELCSGGIRSEVTFPSCWDGRLASEDMASDPHVVYPVHGWEASECPDSHPLRFPTLFFEGIFHVQGLFEVKIYLFLTRAYRAHFCRLVTLWCILSMTTKDTDTMETFSMAGRTVSLM